MSDIQYHDVQYMDAGELREWVARWLAFPDSAHDHLVGPGIDRLASLLGGDSLPHILRTLAGDVEALREDPEVEAMRVDQGMSEEAARLQRADDARTAVYEQAMRDHDEPNWRP
jgi:hypothetical protein